MLAARLRQAVCSPLVDPPLWPGQPNRTTRLAEYERWVPDVLGKVTQEFKEVVRACSVKRCGGARNGRCGSLTDAAAGCVCYDGHAGPRCTTKVAQ